MKSHRPRLMLLGIVLLMQACAPIVQRGEASPEAQSPREMVMQAVELVASLPSRPCAIEKATSTPDGVRLVFARGMKWDFRVPADGASDGVIGNGMVIHWSKVAMIGQDDPLPREPHLDLKYGHELCPSEHHTGCTASASHTQEHALLHTKRSTCMTSMPCLHEETLHRLGDRPLEILHESRWDPVNSRERRSDRPQ